MRIIRVKNYDDMSRQGANIVASLITLKPNCVLGLATGSSPEGLYRELVERYQRGDINFCQVKSVNLDEYVGLSADSEQSYRYFMHHHFFKYINMKPENIHIPCGKNEDAEQECRRYDELLQSLGGIDLQLLGLGMNGHIGFNEPDEIFTTGTHKVKLTESTILANRRFFAKEEDVPRFAYTMGIRDIVHARRVVMLVSGETKADIVRQAFFGPVTPHVPASILQFHQNFTLVADEAALSEI
ncbi:MAG: glucosamine-6-phosphate deaminase [Lachnospiraceae bacterium]|nr:glucosamine-6-phosphate deaminase [Lachnospiraceae bacterium]